LKDSVAEGHGVEVRRYLNRHDRYLIFNERGWPKNLDVIELVDGSPLLERSNGSRKGPSRTHVKLDDRWVPSKAASELPLASTR
jgi:hypothetical protein